MHKESELVGYINQIYGQIGTMLHDVFDIYVLGDVALRSILLVLC